MTVHRIYVEKKKEFSTEASELAKELKDFLKISTIDDLRILHLYQIENLDKNTFEKSVSEILSTPIKDRVFKKPPTYDHILPIELLPGQFDQRADSCAENIALINQGKKPKTKYIKLILLYGSLTSEDLKKIENHLVNPVESRIASLAMPSALKTFDEDVEVISYVEGFIDLSEDEAEEFIHSYSLAMDTKDLFFCQDYFKSEGRNPTLTELKMIDTYWSDHCRHTTFFTEIESADIEDSTVKAAFSDYQKMRKSLGKNGKAITLMDMATIGAKHLKQQGLLTDLDESPEVNACSVHIDVNVKTNIKGVTVESTEPWLLMFKNETHNHPTEIEPFGGAATCLGGAIRDPLSGRAYVYQAMRITGAYDPLLNFAETLPGKLPQRTIAKEAAKGYSSYGNQIGVPGGLVREIYHPGYQAKRLEMGAVVAAAPAHQVIREEPIEGDVVILLGGKTGRDGLGGATGSSKSHDSSSLEKSGPQVQKGNAPEERKIQRFFRNPQLTKLIKRCNDFGAGGVSVAVGELADSIHINLDEIPLKYPGLNGTEIAISESQERMAVVINKEDIDIFLQLASEENLEARVIARITSTGRLVMNFKGENIVDLSREFLDSNGTIKYTRVKVPSMDKESNEIKNFSSVIRNNCLSNLKSDLEFLANNLNHCSQKGLAQIFDFTAGGNTVLAPFGGHYEESPIQAMAAKIPVLNGETSTCSLASFGFDPYLTERNPFQGAYLAVIHSVGKLLATGGDIGKCWLSFQEYFERLEDDPLKWGKPFSALLGALKAQKDLGLAAIGGKDSMSGSFENLNVPPTLISVAVCLGEISEIISPEFKSPDNSIVYLKAKEEETILNFYKKVRKLIKEKKVLSAYALSGAGIGGALFEMSLGNRIGVKFSKEFLNKFPGKDLFQADYGSFILELDSANQDFPGVLLGHTIDSFEIKANDQIIDLKPIRNKYFDKLAPIYPVKNKENTMGLSNAKTKTVKNPKTSAPLRASTLGSPRFLIPLVPGNHGEYELSKKIEEAGGEAEIFIFKNINEQSTKDSLVELAGKIKNSQGLVLPGGMPLGNEPDGGGKYMASILKHPDIALEIQNLLEERDGLILGLGSGFLALMLAGLLPGGHLVSSPDYRSSFQEIEICSNDTPWFLGMEIGEIQKLPIFWNGKALHFRKSKVKTVAKFLSDSTEAATSECGKILGRLASFERTGLGLCKNIPHISTINIFKGAVRYLG